MKNRKLKTVVDIFLFLFLILSIRSWDSNLTAHVIVGLIFAILLAIHVFLNRRWLVSVSKTLKSGKLNKRIKWKYTIDLLLLFVWIVAILSGFPAIMFVAAENEHLFVFTRIHGVCVRLGCILTIAHVFQHRKQICSYIMRSGI